MCQKLRSKTATNANRDRGACRCMRALLCSLRCRRSNIFVHVDGWPTTLSQSTISPPFLPTHIIIDILSPQIINTIAIVYTHPTMKFSTSSTVLAITIAASTTSAVKLRGHGGKNGNEVHQTTSRHLKASDITESSNLFVKANEQV